MGAILPVILCGGSGTRLWPVSTERAPKPFHDLIETRTLLQATTERMQPGPGRPFLSPVVVCGAPHAALARRQLKAVGVTPSRLVVEPTARGTAAAAALAVEAAREVDPDATLLIAPADHRIDRPEAFEAALARGLAAARDRIVLFSAKPDRAETGYGYIRAGRMRMDGAAEIERFLEKPGRATAEGFLSEGGWGWNAGLFLTSVQTLDEELARHASGVQGAVQAAWRAGRRRGVEVRPDADAFEPCEAVSLDRAVIERSDRLAVVDCDMGWSDVGCWNSLWRASQRDPRGNLLHGPSRAVDSSGCLIRSSGPPVLAIGVTGLAIVSAPGGVLVMALDRAQEVGAHRPEAVSATAWDPANEAHASVSGPGG